LNGPFDVCSERFCGVERPVGIAQHRAGEQDDVGFAFGDSLLGFEGRVDHADGSGGDCCVAADGLGEGNLIAGGDGDFGFGDEAAAGAVD